MIRPPPTSTLFPYTTLFRYRQPLPHGDGERIAREHLDPGVPVEHQYRDEHTVGQCGELRGDQLPRSEEHTSELQSLRHLVCRLLLEKKKRTCRYLSRRPQPR